ncbi:protein RRP6-like 1 isoform X1 [Capsella rubella]|uniref:protein RRP6-like 1 isoform X1 n=1 Tax=Capsella rubella TaxID=81985 RepID=UPI000CD58B7F|nr:protein RRP6-like 1 isoform X1 [Capsella rubella]
MSENHNHMAEVKSLNALVDGSFQKTLSKLSSTSRTIPTNSDFQILYSSDEFKRPIDELARSSQCALETIGDKKSVRFVDGGGGDGSFDWLVNVNDAILEKFDDSVDEFKRNRKVKEDSEKAIAVKFKKEHGKAKVPFHLPTINKPQVEYKIVVNNANKPFEHVLLEKSEDGLRFIHPLEKFTVMDFVDKDISEMKPVKYLPLDETPLTIVEEVKDLEELAATLQSVDEFAVDLEHNQYRSFQGLTCLMQISTRTKDYIVDTFKLWDHIGPYLRELFKDPKKKKVMHGADRDIIWLQRDFGIYVCNLFDTGQASRVLKLERNSLEFLLKHYCRVAANKEYQNADWRIRPLPDVMTKYAREDTHYLLYIYDVMQIDLHTMAKENEQSDSPLIEVYKRSYDVCMQLYEKELLTADSYLHVYGVQTGNLNAVQLSIVAGLCEWRDRIAREDDESTGYVLPNKTLFDIAKDMPFYVGQLRRLLKSKHPYIERNFDAVISLIRQSMLKAAAFEPVVQSLRDCRPATVDDSEKTGAKASPSSLSLSKFRVDDSKKQRSDFGVFPSKRKFESDNKVVQKNIKPKIEKTGKEATSSSLNLNKFSVDDSKKQSSGFGVLPSKMKFESDNKAKEVVKVSKSKPDKLTIVLDDDDEPDKQSWETGDASNRASEMSSTGPGSLSMTQKPTTQKPTTSNTEIIVIDDDDESENDGDMSRRSEKDKRFMSLKRGFLDK